MIGQAWVQFLAINRLIPTVSYAPYGTRGDHVPFQYMMDRLNEYGMTIKNHIDDQIEYKNSWGSKVSRRISLISLLTFGFGPWPFFSE